jgi:hypothetical protein
MASAKRMEVSDVGTDELVLSREEIVARLEAGARERLGCDGAEMIARWRAGELTDAGEVADLLVLADLLGENDPLFAG